MQIDTSDPTCPKCSSALENYTVNYGCEFLMCENVKCLYPFDQPSLEPFLNVDGHIPQIEKRNKKKDVRSPNLAPNTAPGAFLSEKAVENLMLNARMQENLENVSTDLPQNVTRPHGNPIALPHKGKSTTSAPTTTYTAPAPETNYSLQEIEHLLQDDLNSTSAQDDDLEQFFTSNDSVSPEGMPHQHLQREQVDGYITFLNNMINIGSEDGASTPRYQRQSDVTTPADDQSGLFKGLDDILGDSWDKKCDPFSTELDSLLGI